MIVVAMYFGGRGDPNIWREPSLPLMDFTANSAASAFFMLETPSAKSVPQTSATAAPMLWRFMWLK
ncbi:hypothetical protein JNB91_23630 [Rhizobium wenxiniae]|uniref:hypothetical protein n=1 Tax=Rhizobium wenxiniae TaxID=1737357 RepID=UPI001C6EA058|nr:hypothetical protein [Rhizobium wenxiniae]MBW9090808.1 hypothetical protein [Rhizobium wenxiniae]